MKGGIIILLTALLFSCSQKQFDSKEELVAYIKDPENGYVQEKQVNGVDIKLMYRPTDLLVAQELRGSKEPERIDSLRRKYNDYLYFNLSLSKDSKELLSAVPQDRNEFGIMVNQLVFGMIDKVTLRTGDQRMIKMIDFSYPRLYGVGRSTAFLLVFPLDELTATEDISLVIEDFGIGTGEVKFKLKQDLISSPPRIF